MSASRNLITPEELRTLLTSSPLRVFDCRFDLADPRYGRERYAEGHVPGSVYVSLDEDLTAPLGAHGGRHPLPSVSEMSACFGRLGIRRGAHSVVAYDDAGGPYAARLWWMLRYCGHDDVRVLDGGWQAWLEHGGAVATDEGGYTGEQFFAEPRSWMLVDVDTVRRLGGSERLFDSRAHERYTGENETIDPVAGHIPGAVNLPWEGALGDSLRMLPRDVLAARYANTDSSSVYYCGSGVTACVNLLAAEEAGCELPRLYGGGWSDWITWPDAPMATGDNS
jgi:thiosulfate/3-mercaptopyruvate sulfurtransferase